MLAYALIYLLNRCFGLGHMAQRVQQHKIMDGAVIANRVDTHAGVFQLSGIRLALIAQWIVFRGTSTISWKRYWTYFGPDHFVSN
jgi:hypothetical protein